MGSHCSCAQVGIAPLAALRSEPGRVTHFREAYTQLPGAQGKYKIPWFDDVALHRLILVHLEFYFTMRNNFIFAFFLVSLFSLFSLTLASPSSGNAAKRADVSPTQAHNPLDSGCGTGYKDCACRDPGICCEKNGDCCGYGWCCPSGCVFYACRLSGSKH